ncbi:protein MICRORCHIDIA 6 isoform X2 [Nymphaea colorata]|nr:protein MICRORCHIDIA 6 isoform X2 [Nymphaea colorata]XP_031505087.1 protein MICRORCHIDIA 6 isoform X2 [Nymphaea colorata]
MSFLDIVDLTSDEDTERIDEKAVILETVAVPDVNRLSEPYHSESLNQQTTEVQVRKQGSSDEIVLGTFKKNHLPQEQARSGLDAHGKASLPPGFSWATCRQFWKAGNYHSGKTCNLKIANGGNRMRVHPKFLHSNATSHKWALGAIAELLDNAVDEIHNGATFVNIDKIIDPRDQCPALLIQDDGGGMDPECLRKCMSLGYSGKKSSAIGQYGNGFKTSTMRIGADVIVFTSCMKTRVCTQSIGLLSYTFLTQTGQEDTVVPMVDYELSPATRERKPIIRTSEKDWVYNMSTILQWSPYQTESDLLVQFDDIGHHGTKIVIYNLWHNDDGDMELDFESDEEDIKISGAPKPEHTGHHTRMLTHMHVANQYLYSLRVYVSILYLQLPNSFSIVLRGRVVEHHKLVDNLKFPQYILYKPQIGGNKEAEVITIIGFVKEAPHVNVQGFNVYHKNRLIRPFWRVWLDPSSRGRGVVGVLEANFIEPAHDKQDFEKTAVFQKLEARLKTMAVEYWNLHCALIGYKPPVLKIKSQGSDSNHKPVRMELVSGTTGMAAIGLQPSSMKRKPPSNLGDTETFKRPAITGQNAIPPYFETSDKADDSRRLQESRELLEENEKLQRQCREYEKVEEELELKVRQLEIELHEMQTKYARLLLESQESKLKSEKP